MTNLTKLVSLAHMRDDLIVQVKASAPVVAGAGLTWGLQEWSQLISIGVGLATLLFIIAQAAYLLRRWYQREKHGWFNSAIDKDTE